MADRPSRNGGNPKDASRERRLFIAVPVPDAVRVFVAELVERVREADGEAPDTGRSSRGPRWVSLDALHLTIRFLGATAEARLPDLRKVVDRVAAGRPPFRVALGGGGAFPSLDRPRAIWLGVADPDAGLAALTTGVGRELVSAGWPADERPFTPHLTLARTDGVRRGPAVARRLAATAEGLEVWFEVDRLVLFESHTGGGPARYVALHEARLGG